MEFLANEHYDVTPRPLSQIRADLDETGTMVSVLEPLEGRRDHYLAEIADAYDRGDYAAAEMAARTYDEVTYELPALLDERVKLRRELCSHPDWLPYAHNLGKLALNIVSTI